MNIQSRRCRILPESPLPNIHNRSTPKKGSNQVQRGIYSKCNVCGEFSQSVSCIDCYHLLCINCGIAHSKQHPSHLVTDVREAHLKIADQIKYYDERIRYIKENINQKIPIPKNSIDCHIFEESLFKLNNIRKEVESLVYNFFEKIHNQYIVLWNDFIDLWGQNKTFQDKLTLIQQKFQLFLQNEVYDNPQMLDQIFKEKLLIQSKQIIIQYEKREQLENQENKETIFPPRLVFDLSCITKINIQLQSLLQLLDWQKESQANNYQIQGESYEDFYLIPTCAKVMYLYNPLTTEYQIGEFQGLKHKQIPQYSKSIYLHDGTLLLVGGADEKCNPSRSLLQCKDGELINLAPLPRAKNPINGLVLYENFVYVIGGMRNEENKVQWSKSCEKYSIAENKWYHIESMMYPKPHQTVFRIGQIIYAFGMQMYDFVNFEQYDIMLGKWQTIKLPQQSINPFLIGGGYQATHINETQALIFGGKMWSKKIIDEEKELCYDEEILKIVFLYDKTINQFISLGDCMPGTGVSYGEFTPVCFREKVICFESPISKQRKIHKWLQIMNVVQLSFDNHILESEIIQMLTPD